MKKKLGSLFLALLILCMVLLLAGYVGLSLYYRNGFAYGTWINGIYCTGKTIDEVNKELSSKYSYSGLEVRWGDGKKVEIPAEQVYYEADFQRALKLFLEGQKSGSWIKNLLGKNDRMLKPVVSIREEALSSIFLSLPFMAEQKNLYPNEVKLIETDAGYVLHDGTKGILDKDAAMNAIRKGFIDSEDYIDLEEAGCFYDLEVTEQMRQISALWEKIDAYQSRSIIYRFDDEQEVVDASVLCSFLCTDEQGQLLLDDNGDLKVDKGQTDAYVDEMADRHDTIGAERVIHATRGEDVTVKGGTYGNEMDREAEKAYLYAAAENAVGEEIHVPAFTIQGKSLNSDDIGSTYIEVDITEQMLYYYVDGQLRLETPVVTGNELLRRDTPCGVNYVYLKQQNRVLRGPGYASPVKFWMPVNRGIGIHDASWRAEYGEEIYKTNGSHGCINTPYEKMKQLYEEVEVGTPVIILK